jgi:hypothetical protein
LPQHALQGQNLLPRQLLIKDSGHYQLGEKNHTDQRQPMRSRTRNRPEQTAGQKRLCRQDMPAAAMARHGAGCTTVSGAWSSAIRERTRKLNTDARFVVQDLI